MAEAPPPNQLQRRPNRPQPNKRLMLDLIAALGLALAVEGILFAAFPDGMRRAMYEAAHSPSDQMRIVGIISALIGVGVIWLVRHFS